MSKSLTDNHWAAAGYIAVARKRAVDRGPQSVWDINGKRFVTDFKALDPCIQGWRFRITADGMIEKAC